MVLVFKFCRRKGDPDSSLRRELKIILLPMLSKVKLKLASAWYHRCSFMDADPIPFYHGYQIRRILKGS